MSPNTLGLATAPTPEHRHSNRRKVGSLIYLKIPPGNGGILHDISENGMGVSMANPLSGESDCRFSILRQNGPPIQGVGRVAWISKSGKAAGLRFVELTDESRQQIRQWVESGVGERENPAEANFTGMTETATEKAMPSAEETAPSLRSETKPSTKRTETPLYFLPQKRMDDEPGSEAPAEDMFTQPAREGTSGLEEVRIALQEPHKNKQNKEKKGDILFAVQVLCVAAIALACGFLLIYKGEDALQYVKSHTPVSLPFSSAVSVEPASSTRTQTTRPRRRAHSSPRETAARDTAAETPAIWKAPSQGVPFQLEVTDSFNRRWLITASGQKVFSTHRQAAPVPDSALAQPPAQTTEQAEPTDDPANVAEATNPAASAVASANTPAGPRTIVAPKLQTGADTPFTVVLDALIGQDGSVKNVHVIHSPSAALAWAVVEAVKKWRYPPFYQDGHPAEVVTRITVAFEGRTPKR